MLDLQELLREQVLFWDCKGGTPCFFFIEEKQIWIQDSKRTFLIILLL